MKRQASIYFVSFLQGGTIMGYELLVPKLIAPFFGGSVYVWAGSLVFSMLGLTLGYFGAGLTNKERSLVTARWVLLFAALLIFMITLLSGILNELLLDIPLKSGILLSSFLHLTPVYFLLGMISPLLIAHLSHDDARKPGVIAGNIFACSTAAGIFFSLFVGFYLIPELGIVFSSRFLTVTVLLAALIMFLKGRRSVAYESSI